MTDLLKAVTQLLCRHGQPLSGFGKEDAQAEADATLNGAGGRYCLVREWIIVDVKVSDNYRASLSAAGLMSEGLYASSVVLHSAGRRRAGDWVRTTFRLSSSVVHLFSNEKYYLPIDGPWLSKKGKGRNHFGHRRVSFFL